MPKQGQQISCSILCALKKTDNSAVSFSLLFDQALRNSKSGFHFVVQLIQFAIIKVYPIPIEFYEQKVGIRNCLRQSDQVFVRISFYPAPSFIPFLFLDQCRGYCSIFCRSLILMLHFANCHSHVQTIHIHVTGFHFDCSFAYSSHWCVWVHCHIGLSSDF